MKAWKAFRIDKQGKLRFLFHTYKGNSIVPIGQWIETKRKWVSEGSNPKRKYRAGFHFFPSIEASKRFERLTKNKYLILPVLVDGTWPKPHSSVGTWLAKRIYIFHGSINPAFCPRRAKKGLRGQGAKKADAGLEALSTICAKKTGWHPGNRAGKVEMKRYPQCSSCKFFLRDPKKDYWDNYCLKSASRPIKLDNPNVTGIRLAMCRHFIKAGRREVKK